jgi:hypothetical protein
MHRSERWAWRVFLVKPVLRDGFALKETQRRLLMSSRSPELVGTSGFLSLRV